MKDLKPVEPFKFTYRVLDRITMLILGEYENLDKVADAFSKWRGHFSDGYGQKIAHNYLLGTLYIRHPLRSENKGRYAILRVEDGYVLFHKDFMELFRSRRKKRYYREGNEYDRSKDLIKVKHGPEKIKKDWSARRVPAHWSYGYFCEEYYNNCYHMSYHRLGKMIREQRINMGIVDEYEDEYPNIVRGRRKGLPSGWSGEKAISAFKTVKSWKHHSKRRKQWISK